jgi:CheY-like chemotaxis protein
LCEEDVTAFFHLEALELMKTKRHSLANWWGVLRLFDVLHEFFGMSDDSLPPGLLGTLEMDGSYQGILMNHSRFQGPPPPFFKDYDLQETGMGYMSALWERDLRVVFIDDEADMGWAYLLQYILYGKERSDLFVAPAVGRERVDIDALLDKTLSWSPDLVILDVRLSSEDETASVEELSGLALLQKLTSLETSVRPVSCPILVFTASDKREVGDIAIQRGADAVWTKEGVDEGEHLSGGDYRLFSLKRFFDLVAKIRRLTGEEYALLYGFLGRIRQLEQSDHSFWWENASWYPGDPKQHKPLQRQAVIHELNRLFMTHKQLLTSPQPEIRESIYELLMIRLGRMMEVIHPSRFEADGNMVTLGKGIQQDWPVMTKGAVFSTQIVNERNNFVHFDSFSSGQNLDSIRYGEILSVFFDYLTMDTGLFSIPDLLKGILQPSVGREDRTGYSLKDEESLGYASFNDSDAVCEELLGGMSARNNVQATIVAVSLRYVLKKVDLSKDRDTSFENWWTANYRILRWGSWGVDVALSHILPRKGVSFRLPFPAEDVRPGTLLYFYAHFVDEGKKDGLRCAIWRTSFRKPEQSELSYWTARVQNVWTPDQAERGSTVILNDITPPFAAYFRIPTVSFDKDTIKQDQGKSWICFLPQFWQKVTVGNPTLIADNE